MSIAFEVNKMSKPTLTLDRYTSYFNGNINNVKHDDKVVHEIDFFAEYGKRFEKLGIDEKKKEIIQSLSKEFQLFIVSSTTTDIITAYLKRHEIFFCFTEIFGNEVHTSKVKKFQMLFERYNIDPKDVIFITDSSGDIKEAKEVSIKTIVGILGGYQNEENLKQGKPTTILKDFAQFWDFVQAQL